jgi:hypothetical protein
MGGGPGTTPIERMDNLLKMADRMGVEHLSLHLGMVTGIEDPSPEQLTKDNNAVMEACRHAGKRAHGYVYLNQNHLDFSLKEFDRCVRDGPMVGVKLWIAKRCNAPARPPAPEPLSSCRSLASRRNSERRARSSSSAKGPLRAKSSISRSMANCTVRGS